MKIYRNRLGHTVGWAVLLLVAGLLATGLAVRAVKAALDREAEQNFTAECAAIQARIEVRISAHQQVLRSGAAFFCNTEGVTRQEFHEFAERQKIDQALPGIQGIGFAKLLPRAQLAAHLDAVRGEGFAEYRVWPEGEREIYSSIVFLEPFAGRNLRAFGFDMLTEGLRCAAMEQARDEDATVLSGKVMLVQENGQDPQAGTLMYAPVYQMGQPRSTLAERRAALSGWVYSPYRMNDLLQGILANRATLASEHIRLQIFDGTSAASAALLYDSEPSSRDVPAGSPVSAQHQISVAAAGRSWLLHFAHSGGAVVSPVGGQVWWVGCGGTLTSLLLAGLALSLVTTQANAGMIARRLTRDLSESEERWKFALEGAGDGVWDWDVVTGEVFYSKRWKEMLGYAGDESLVVIGEWRSRIHPDDVDLVMAQINTYLADPSVEYYKEHRLHCKDGSWKWILTRGQAVSRDATGRVLRMIGTHQDISARKSSEAEIARLSAIQRELAHLACSFINVPVAEQHAAVDQSLALMGRCLGVDRARLFAYDFPAGTVAVIHEWCAPGVATTLTDKQLLVSQSSATSVRAATFG